MSRKIYRLPQPSLGQTVQPPKTGGVSLFLKVVMSYSGVQGEYGRGAAAASSKGKFFKGIDLNGAF